MLALISDVAITPIFPVHFVRALYPWHFVSVQTTDWSMNRLALWLHLILNCLTMLADDLQRLRLLHYLSLSMVAYWTF